MKPYRFQFAPIDGPGMPIQISAYRIADAWAGLSQVVIKWSDYQYVSRKRGAGNPADAERNRQLIARLGTL